MKKNNLFIIIATCLMLPGSVYAAGTCIQYTPNADDDDAEECEAVEVDCSSPSSIRYYRNSTGDHCYIVEDCNSCPSPLKIATLSVPDCTGVTYQGCKCTCTGTKPADPGWEDTDTVPGYQEYLVYECSCDSGSAQWVPVATDYRCAAGFYGNAEWGGTSGCEMCPPASNIFTSSALKIRARGTSAAGTTSVAGCYIPARTYYDATGTFTITSSCMY